PRVWLPAQTRANDAGKLLVGLGAERSRRMLVLRRPAVVLLGRRCAVALRGRCDRTRLWRWRLARGRALRSRRAAEPGVDQVDLVGRQVEPLLTAACHHEIAEAAGEEIG